MPEGFCKVILLSIATSWQWQGIKASGPPLATSLLGSVQVELQPHGAAQGEKGFEREGFERGSAALLLRVPGKQVLVGVLVPPCSLPRLTCSASPGSP